MTLHRIHCGDGYEYLTRNVATGDQPRDRTRDLTDYYTAHGTPPGRWFGKGAATLGLSGEVTEQQMQLLFGEGMHPDANRIITESLAEGKSITDAIAAASLGANFYRYSDKTPVGEWLEQLVIAFTEKNGRRPTYDERTQLRTEAARDHLRATLNTEPSREAIQDALAEDKTHSRKAVAGFDCVFTPMKSVAILWGLADDETRRIIWQCHEEAMTETLAFAEQRFAVTRRGHNGVRQIDADGFTVALFRHYDSRTGDPLPHTHATISAKVRGSDGKWSALDARPLYGGAVGMSCRYNATLVGKMRRKLGCRFEERSHGRGRQPVLELEGIPDEMIAFFSQRRVAIVARVEQLLADYRETHGRNPDKRAQIALAQQATLETRQAKAPSQGLRGMLVDWDYRVRGFLGDGRDAAAFATDLLARHRNRADKQPFDPYRIAIATGVRLGGAAAVLRATPDAMNAAVNQAIDMLVTPVPQQRAAAIATVSGLLSAPGDLDLYDDIDNALDAAHRVHYRPDIIAADVAATVARRRATWTEDNIRAAAEDRIALCELPTDSAHRAAVEQIVTTVRDRLSIRLTIDPDPVPEVIARRNGESEFTVTGATRYTSHTVLAAEQRLLDAATTPTTHYLSAATVDAEIAETEHREGRTLNDGQRAIATHLCIAGTELAVAVGPAGSGKTTAMTVVADAWRRTGRPVMALAPSKSAARLLGERIGTPGSTIARVLTLARLGLDTGIRSGTMLLVDEAAMAATHDLETLQTLARHADAVVRWIGDPHQLSAVESGGAMRLLANDTRAPALSTLVRFRDAAEAGATLHVRDGNIIQAWDFYHDTGRITSGMVDELRAHILTAHLADIAAGKTSLMLAASLDDVASLNLAAQAAHIFTGRVTTTVGQISLSDGTQGHVGDVVVTRSNENTIRITGGRRSGTGIDNGDLWRIRTIHTDGSITVTGIDHRGHTRLPAHYIAINTELGYASTVHRSQGMTVDRSHVLMNATLGRAMAYVGLTRGAESNRIYLATDALDPTCDHQPEDPITEQHMFARVLSREDDNLTAIETMRAEQARIDNPERLLGIYSHITRLLAHARANYLLDRALPAAYYHHAQQSEHFPALLDTIARADQHRLDTRALVKAIATHNNQDLGESLAGARDTAAVLRARADLWIAANHTRTAPATNAVAGSPATAAIPLADDTGTRSQPQRFRALRDAPLDSQCPPVPPRHPGTDIELADYADELFQRLSVPTNSTNESDTTERGHADHIAPVGGLPETATTVDAPVVDADRAEVGHRSRTRFRQSPNRSARRSRGPF